MTTSKVETSNKQVQTTIRCFPHILLSNSELARVTCDRSCQTATTVAPEDTNLNFYSLLEFTPYQVIVEGSIKELDLPRRALLQWNLPTVKDKALTSSSISLFSKATEREDSELFRLQKGVLKKSPSSSTNISSFNRPHHHATMQKSVVSAGVQTQLSVSPHILDTDEVANVFTELSIQTSITCLPNDSISNILPQLKANLSHFSAYNEHIDSNQQTENVSEIQAEQQTAENEAETELEVVVEIGELHEHTEEKTEENVDVEDTGDAIETEGSKGSEGAQAVSITISTTQAESQQGCNCGSKMLNQIAKQLRVQASTLQLTPKVFPPGTMFEGKMVEVLNTTIAVLQTEMAKMMEIYVEEDKELCACTEKATQKSLEIPDDDNQLALANDPRSCVCGVGVPAQQKEIKKITTTRQTVDPKTMKPDVVKEDTVEEITRTFTLNANNETVVEERIRTTTVRGKLPAAPEAQTLMIEGIPTKTKRKTCECKKTEDTLPIPLEESEVADAPPAEEAGEVNEGPPAEQADEVDDASPGEEAGEVNDAPPAQEAGELDNAPPAEEADVAPPAEQEVIEQPGSSAPSPELFGDFKENKRMSFIPCECHPTEAGAAPAILSPEPDEVSDNASLPCSCHNSQSDLAHASSAVDDEPSMGADLPSLVDDAPSPEKTIKFEILLKKGVKDVESASATSAIVIRATLSCPETNKDGKKTQAKASLPDLREQVIRLSVMYKNGPTEPETRIEELLTPGRQIKIAPNKLASSNVSQIPSNTPTAIPITDNTICECGRLVCARRPSQMLVAPYNESDNINNNNNNDYATTFQAADPESHVCSCGTQESTPQEPEYNGLFSNLPIEIEEVPFSIMPCPVHAVKKPPSCVPTCTSRSAPSSQPPIRKPIALPTTRTNIEKPADTTNLEITISFGIQGEHDEQQPKEEIRSLSFMYEHDAYYDEPYMEQLFEIEDAAAAVQTDLTLGDKLESESLNSLEKEGKEDEADDGEEPKPCTSKTEMPWQKISLPPPGSYSIKPIKASIEFTPQLDNILAAGLPAEPVEGEATEITEGDEPVEAPEEEILEEDDTAEEGGEGGEQEGNEGGEEPPPEPPAEEPPAEPEPTDRRGRKEPLLFETEILKHNEPYMEGLYRAYPNSDDEDGGCGSTTEIPWKDILLPENCKIRKAKKSKKCICKSKSEKLQGMFIPTTKFPRNLDVDEDEGILELNLGFEDVTSFIIPVDDGQPRDGLFSVVSAISTVSNMLPQPKRCPKEYVLQVDLSKENNYGISFQAGGGQPQRIPIGSAIQPRTSLPFSVTTKQETQGKTSSVIVNIKPSTECQFPSVKMPVSTESREIRVIEPSMYVGTVPMETRSCEATNDRKVCINNGSAIKNASSMPQIPSQKSVKATVSLKRLGQPDKVVTQQMDLAPGENLMSIQLPDEPINVKLKMSTPQIRPGPTTGAPSYGASAPTPTCAQPQQPEEIFSPAKCTCKDKVKLNTFRQDPVMAALEAYEAEMKPLRQALTQLQQKIRNLNMPEMKGCVCTTALYGPQTSAQQSGMYPSSVRSKVHISGSPGTTTRTTMRVRPGSNQGGGFGPQGTCPFFQPAGFGPPPQPSAMYGRLPPPMVPPRHQPYMASPPNYTPQSANDHHRNCVCQRGSTSSHRNSAGRREKHCGERRSSRDHGRHGRDDLAMQARNYGMYPDYRGRKYPDEQMAYHDSSTSRRHKESGPQKYKVRNIVSAHSSGNATSDYSGYDSQGASDGEELCPQVLEPRRRSSRHKSKHKSKHHRSKHSSSSPKPSKFDCVPCKDYFDNQDLRPGQAMKTSPDEFLPTSRRSSKSRGCAARQSNSGYTMPKVVSRQKIQIKFPYN